LPIGTIRPGREAELEQARQKDLFIEEEVRESAMREDARSTGVSSDIGRHLRSAASYLILCAFLCLMLDACGPRSEQVRRETKKPEVERFPSERTLVGKGCVALTGEAAVDRREADQAARAEVAKQLEVQVIQVVEDIQREEQQGAERSASYSVSVRTREFVDRKLKGVRIEERKRIKEQGLQCSVAVLDKAAMAFQLREEIEGDLQEIRSLLADAQSSQNTVHALRAYSLAMLSSDRVAVNAKMLLGLGYRPPEGPSRPEIWRNRTEVLEGIRLVRAGGQGQRATPGRPLTEPLRVAAVDRSGQPLSNLPLEVIRAPEGCDIQGEAQTGTGGDAEFWVYRVVSNRMALEEAEIGIDWGRLLAAGAQGEEEAAPWGDWDTRAVVFTYRIPVPGDYRVGVAVFESGTGRPLKTSPIQSSLFEGLQKMGFKTQDLFVASYLRKRPAPEQARKLLQERVDILVLGDVSLRYSSESSGFTFYRARGVVEGVALASGSTILTLDLEAKGGGLDHDQAARKALGNLAKRLELEIGPALEAGLE
jgi:hypothetical protein